MQKRTQVNLFVAVIVGIVVAISFVMVFSGNFEADEQSYSNIPKTNDVLLSNELSKWIASAKDIAGNKNIGYSTEHTDLNPDVMCYSFVYYALARSGSSIVNEPELARAFSKYCDDNYASNSMETQFKALKDLGFTEHVFTGFENDPDLVPGSILYAQNTNKTLTHVEIYIGKYNLDKTDQYGNPIEEADNGYPITMGARNPDHDPAPGDQLQPCDNDWWEGEVAAWKWDSRGQDYWKIYLAPPK